jgi:hypothetical protein
MFVKNLPPLPHRTYPSIDRRALTILFYWCGYSMNAQPEQIIATQHYALFQARTATVEV